MTQTYKVQVSMNQAHIVESGFVWKQGDFGFNIEIEVLDFDTTGATPQIIFRKSTGAVEATQISVAGNKFTYAIRGTELDTPGPCVCDLKLKDSTTKRVSTASFKYFVIPDTMDGLNQQASSYSDTIAQIIDGYDTELAKFKGDIAPTYSASSTYEVGQYVLYNDVLYRCTTDIATAEAWTAGHWQQVSIGGESANLKKSINITDNGGYLPCDVTFTEGGYISNSNGEVIPYANWKYTDYIDISKRDFNSIIAFTTASDNRNYNAYYNANKTFISAFSSETGEITPPVSAKYVRLSVQSSRTTGVSIKIVGLFDKLNRSELEQTLEPIREELTLENMRFIPGGIDVSTGLPIDAQKYRLHTTYFRNDKNVKVTLNKSFNATKPVSILVFSWNDYDPTATCDSKTKWLNILENVYYDLPIGKWIRIVVAYNVETGAQDITDPYTSDLFNTLLFIESNTQATIKDLKDASFYDLKDVTASSGFIPGGLQVDAGLPTGAQYYRIHSSFTYASKDLRITKKKTPSEQIGYKVFLWNANTPNVAADTISTWYILGQSDYTIPKGKYYRILVCYWNEASHTSEVISNVYESELFLSFKIESGDDESLNRDIIYLNKDVEPNVQSLKTSYPSNAKPYFNANHTPLSFVHFSDIHNVPILWKRIAEYCDKYKSYLPFALHTGDYVGDNQTAYTDLYEYYMPTVPFLNCVGNHDTYTNAQHQTGSKQSTHDLLFNHTNNWGVTFDTDIDYSMSYYKDFTDSNIRLIVLDNYYDINAQKSWLQDLLDEALTNGYHVITAAHQVTNAPDSKVDCTFQTLIPYESAGTGSVTFTEFDSVIGDFIRAGGKHIVHLCGHEHEDWFYYTANGVLNCAVSCATTYLGWSEGARVENTKTWDCFNCVGADTDLGVLKIIRIGANCDSHNRVKNVLSYDYINKKVLCNI